MPRHPRLNKHPQHGYYSTINGKKFYFGKDYERAHKEFIDKLAKNNRGEVLSNPSVASIVAEFLDYKKAISSPATFDWYEYPLLNFAEHVGPKRKVSGLSTSDAEMWIAKHWSKTKRGKIMTANSQRHPKRALKHCFAWAADNRRISFNPFKTMKIGDYSGAPNVPTDEQLQKLLNHFKHDEDLIDLLNFELVTGARVSECRSIKVHQVDVDKAQITLSEEQSKGYEKSNRLRIIILNADALEIVKRNLAKHSDSEALLFQNPTSKHSDNRWTPAAVRSKFYRAEKKLGFRITQRSLRHVFATKFLLGGGNIVSGSILLGHSSVKMLTQNYQKIVNERQHLLEQASIVKPLTPLSP